MKTVVGIDLGTQSVKVMFYDFENRAVAATAAAPLSLHQEPDGTAEQRADWWISALRQSLAGVDASVRASAVALGVSGQQHGFVPLDRSGGVLAPVKLWCDTSTEQECREIMGRFGGPEACLDQVGNLILPGYTASKIAWLRKRQAAVYEALDCVLLPHDYLNFWLTGERCMEAGDASGTGFLDIRSRTWSTAMLRAIDPDRDLAACLPDVALANQVIGHVGEGAADTLGLPPGLPVSVGGGDNMMGAIGTGNLSPGVLTMSLGTSGTVYAYSDHPVIDPAGEIAAFCSSTGGWLPLLCTMNCTVSTELLRNLLAADIESFENLVGKAAPGSDGVITLPYFNGERTPNLPRAKGCVVGLDTTNCRAENLLRSAMEGATFALRYGIDRLRDLGIQTREIILTGGGARSATWRQVVADVCDTAVTVYRQDEGASFGAALQALSALDGAADLRELARDHLIRDPARCHAPEPSAVERYRQAYDGYRDAMASIRSLYG